MRSFTVNLFGLFGTAYAKMEDLVKMVSNVRCKH